jgi:hypothetical protein
VGGIERIAAAIGEELRRRLPGQRKTQREGLALLVATMLSERSANLMDLAAALPRAAERIDMRYQWIARLLGNPLVDAGAALRRAGVAFGLARRGDRGRDGLGPPGAPARPGGRLVA